MSYIERKEIVVNKLVCTHPKIKKIWELGCLAAIPTDSKMTRIVCLLWYDGDKECRREFEDDGGGQAIIDAEKFLETL